METQENGREPMSDDRPDRAPVVLAWSGGKDSSLALAALRASPLWNPVALLTTVTEEYDRISMHGVRSSLLRAQAAAIGLPLTSVTIPRAASDQIYQERMGVEMLRVRQAGVHTVAFGDLFLEDVRAYRERMLDQVGMRAIFPLWRRPTATLAEEFIDAGYRAILTCVDTQQIPASFAGRDYDRPMLDDLPPDADRCGENGEFHTFVYDGPTFATGVACARGERLLRDERFMYCDLT
jgi:uncharacterized protein (TIGR00290 family)